MVKYLATRHLPLSRPCILALLAAVCILFSGCSSSRQANQSAIEKANSPLSTQLKHAIESAGNWRELQVPLKLSITEPQKFSLSGRAYMIRDERIYISMRVLGLEVASLDLTPDSLIVLDKYHRQQIIEPVADILKEADITIGDIQDALLGRFFINGNAGLADLKASEVKTTSLSAGKWAATPRKKIHGVAYTFIFNANDNVEQLTAEIESTPVGISYSDPVTTKAGVFSQLATILTAVGGTDIELSLKWNFGSVKWSVGKLSTSSRRSGYKTIDASRLVKSMSSGSQPQ